MLALPPAPAPTRPRLLLVGTALVCVAGSMLFAGLLAIYLQARDTAGGTTAAWFPPGVKVPGIAANILVITMIGAVIVASWAVYAIRRGARTDSYVALGATIMFGLAVLNAQVYIWRQMKVGILKPAGQPFPLFFYSTTGTLFVALVTGVVFTVVMAFRTLGGRSTPKDSEGLTALAMYWYFLAAATVAVWFVVYVNK
jgi:heme/copper-type cytochrome/quinol oxidase subunit 3